MIQAIMSRIQTNNRLTLCPTRYIPPAPKELVMSNGHEDYAGEAKEMALVEEEHQGDADVARYERDKKGGE